MRLWSLLASAILLFATCLAAVAQRELHVISVQRGWIDAKDYRSEPQVRVLVDRPGVEVVLVLLDTGTIDWFVDTADGSFVETIILGSPEVSTSRVFFKEVRFSSPNESDLPFVRGHLGRSFRFLSNRLADLSGIERISSFQSIYRAGQAAYRVETIDRETTTLARDYLEGLVADSDALPVGFRDWIAHNSETSSPASSFDDTGMTMSDETGTRFFPVPNDIVRPFLPAGTYYDATAQSLYGISYGGDGYLYRVDTQSGQWSVVANLQGYDGAALMFDRQSGRFILTGAFNRPGEIRVLDPDGGFQTTNIEVRRFPGLTDLYDYPDEAAPVLTPRAFDGEWVLLEAVSDVATPRAGYGLYRLYAVNLETEEVLLLNYRNR